MQDLIERALSESFVALCAEKPVEKITVQEIAQRAGVSKQTFYNHFQDKQDLMNSVLDRETAHLRAQFESMPFNLDGVIELVGAIMEYCQRRKDYYRAIAGYMTQNSFEQFLWEATYDFYLQLARSADAAPSSQAHLCELVEFTTAGCTRLLLKWIRGGMAGDPYGKAAEIVGFLPSEMRALIDEADRTVSDC